MAGSNIIYKDAGYTENKPGFLSFIKSVFILPHISRRITAPVPNAKKTLVLFVILTTIFTANLIYEYQKSPDMEKSLQQLILRNPSDSKLHEKLGGYYLTINKNAAKREFDLAQEYYSYSLTPPINILGIETQPADRFKEITDSREKIMKEIEYWEKISLFLPEYSYSTMKTAVLYYQLDDKVKTNELTKLLLWQMPGDKLVQKIVDRLKI